jgi:hypothetical protein
MIRLEMSGLFVLCSLVKAYPLQPISSPKPLIKMAEANMSNKPKILKPAIFPSRSA